MNLFELFTDKPSEEELLAPVRQALEEPDVLTFGGEMGFQAWYETKGDITFRRFGGVVCMLMAVSFIIQYPDGIVLSGIFFVLGYWMTFSFTARLDIDLQRRRWVHRPGGVRPFIRETEGLLDEWEQVRFARQDDGEGTDFWSVSLIARAGNSAPRTFPAFYFPCPSVSREAVLVLAQRLARKLDLPLREEAEAQKS